MPDDETREDKIERIKEIIDGDDADSVEDHRLTFGSKDNPGSVTTSPSWNLTLGPKHTPEEKAYFHAIKAARRLAELEYHRESAELARLIAEWYESVEDETDA